MPEPSPAQLLRVEKMVYGGSGVARDQAGVREQLLPFVLPDEVVQVSVASVEVVESSADRTQPVCIHFGECGGCHYQHASYPAQVAIKAGILRDIFTTAGINGLPEIAVHTSEPIGYRNRIRLRVGEVANEDGLQIRMGYNRREAGGQARQFLPITMCPIAAPRLMRAAGALVDAAETSPLVARWLRSAVEIELFTTGDETKLQLIVFVRGKPGRDFDAFCDLVSKAVPQLAGAGVALLPAQASPHGRRSERPKPGPQFGVPGMIYPVQEDRHWVSRGSFFQVNRFLVAELLGLATAGRSGTLAWDLYAGVGLFSRSLARSFEQVVAVEAAEPAASDLARSIKGTSHRALAMTTLDFLQAAVVQRERPDLIVMDPPRAGVGPEVCALLTRVRAPVIVYVSCDPVTLARDIKQLTSEDGGYGLSALHLVDMFPQTFHMEAVAVLHARQT